MRQQDTISSTQLNLELLKLYYELRKSSTTDYSKFALWLQSQEAKFVMRELALSTVSISKEYQKQARSRLREIKDLQNLVLSLRKELHSETD